MKHRLREDLQRRLERKEPLLWPNDGWRSLEDARAKSVLNLTDVYDAERRLSRFAVLLARLFPELRNCGGLIESPLYPAPALKFAMSVQSEQAGNWFVKADHMLPVAGSIKARGGIYEVLLHAEELALRHALIDSHDDLIRLDSRAVRKFFAQHQVIVGSTGNLGLSIGVMAAALGFQAIVHMSADAKAWKKERLRARGVEVIEHSADFGAAVAAGREQARQIPFAYFVDDENSPRLFLGYSVAAIRLALQLQTCQIKVDGQHPLFVYLPCGVGGAPGGITFGLRHLFGDHVHCFFAEPVAAPCLLIRLASMDDAPIDIADVGLDGRTEADGLAVGRASEFVAGIVRPLVSGIFTVPDTHLFEDLYTLERGVGLRVEPSATAGFRGPDWLLRSDAGRQYLEHHGLLPTFAQATHVLWTTGGAFLPEEEYRRFYVRGRGMVS